MFQVNLDAQNHFSKNSKEFKVSKEKLYETSTQFIGKSGEAFCAYFGVIFLDDKNEEKKRIIKWFNDFSGQKQQIKIVFKPLTEKIILIYRINNETPVTSEINVDIEPIENVIVKETNSSKESFDDIKNVILPRKKELTEIEEDVLEKNLVWVFCHARSGSSWLALELLSYQTHSINELHLTEHLGTPNMAFIELSYSRWLDQRKNSNEYFFSDIFKKTWMPFLRKLILNRIYAQVGVLNKKVILKEPSVASGADVISECFPNSRIIFLFRDGRDIIDSLLDGRQKEGFMTLGGAPPVTEENRFNYIQVRSKLWTYLIDNLLKTYENHSEKLRISIKYEDLLNMTKDVLKKIYDFLEIKIKDDELERIVTKFSFQNIPKENKGSGKFARIASPGMWKEHLNEDEKNSMELIMKSTLNKLGYT